MHLSRTFSACATIVCVFVCATIYRARFPPIHSGGRFCSFSPCIEQSQRVCEQLERLGFVEIQSMEILQIEDIVKTKNVPVLDLDFVKHRVSNFSCGNYNKQCICWPTKCNALATLNDHERADISVCVCVRV